LHYFGFLSQYASEAPLEPSNKKEEKQEEEESAQRYIIYLEIYMLSKEHLHPCPIFWAFYECLPHPIYCVNCSPIPTHKP
jgi:hypothetical protein